VGDNNEEGSEGLGERGGVGGSDGGGERDVVGEGRDRHMEIVAWMSFARIVPDGHPATGGYR
jgi:hypothetical protein